MKPLTTQQARVLDFIKRHTAKHQRPPSYCEINVAMGFGVSPNAAACFLRALERKGWIRRGLKRQSRAIELLDKPPRGMPLVTLEQIGRTP